MTLAQKTAADLQTAEGKEKLARQIRREALLPLGVELEDEDEDEDDPKKKKRKRRSAGDDAPIVAVHFSNFIIQ
jgi:flagellar FliL protein